MVTKKHMGRGKLVKRLAAQTGSEGMAIALLKKRGHMDKKGELTKEGKARNRMTAGERAKDRAAKAAGKAPKDFKYDPDTNTARVKKRAN